MNLKPLKWLARYYLTVKTNLGNLLDILSWSLGCDLRSVREERLLCYGCSTVVLICFTCPAITVATLKGSMRVLRSATAVAWHCRAQGGGIYRW